MVGVRQRPMVSLITSCFVLLTAGNLYLYSMFGPQFGEKFGYNQSQIVFISSCANNINLLTGLPIGYLADRPVNIRWLLLFGGTMIWAGYMLVGLTFHGTLASTHYLFLAMYFCFVAIGNHALYVSSQAANLRNWGEDQKGLAIGIPIAFFGLSACVYDIFAYSVFALPGGKVDFFGFFVFIAVSALVVNVIASFLLAYGPALPEPSSQDLALSSYHPIADRESFVSASSTLRDSAISSFPTPHSKLRKDNFQLEALSKDYTDVQPTIITLPERAISGSRTRDGRASAEYTGLLAEDAPLFRAHQQPPSAISSSDGDESPLSEPKFPPFFQSLQSYLIGISMLTVIGSGMMYLTSLGAIILALSDKSALASSSVVQHAQGVHVAIVSIFSFLGRLSIGCLLDICHSRWEVPRATWSVLSAGIMFLGFAYALIHVNLQTLPTVTALIAFGYGMMWTSSPVLVSEYYGNARFAFYWGCLTLLPSVSGFFTNWIFGAVYDAQSRVQSYTATSPVVDAQLTSVSGMNACRGLECFRASFLMTTGMCGIGVLAASILMLRYGSSPSFFVKKSFR